MTNQYVSSHLFLFACAFFPMQPINSLFPKVLCSTWKDDGTTVFSGGCDKQVKMWPLLSGGQPMTVAMHDAPISEIAWIPQLNLLVSGSWDKTLKYIL